MVLESCMVLLDNSQYMRNGDYVPTRLEAQHDAANFLVSAKTQSNPENTVGVIAMCGSSEGSTCAELLVSPTDDMGKILSALHGVPFRNGYTASGSDKQQEEKKSMDMVGKGGGIDIVVSLQVANLALKHRRNKNGAQRIIVFVGSPLTHVDTRSMVRAGRMLKKNNLAIDVVAMGELEENESKLQELVNSANGTSSGDNDTSERTCHLVTIPAGVLPSDVLVSSPIGHGSGMGARVTSISSSAPAGGSDEGGFAEFGGVDPNMDPELAMALRVSMEEERARQERAAAASNAAAQPPVDSTNATENDAAPMEVDSSTNNNTNGTELEVSDEDALLQQALAMSMTSGNTDEDNNAMETTTTDTSATLKTEQPGDGIMDEDDEDKAMQLALQMSMQPDTEEDNKDNKKSNADEEKVQFQDPQFVNQLLGSLPSGNDEDSNLNAALKEILDKKEGDNKEKKDDE